MCISKTLQLRGLLVLGSWYLNGCWTLTEYLYFVGNETSQVEQVVIHRAIVQADLMTIYLAVVDLVAKVAQKRFDPALSLFLFFVTFQCSAAIIRGLPVLIKILSDKTLRDYQMGVVQTLEDLSKITPMRLWNVHSIGATDAAFTIAAITPLLLSLGVILALVMATKLRRRWLLIRQQRGTAVGPLESSRNSSEVVQSKSGSTINLFARIPTILAVLRQSIRQQKRSLPVLVEDLTKCLPKDKTDELEPLKIICVLSALLAHVLCGDFIEYRPLLEKLPKKSRLAMNRVLGEEYTRELSCGTSLQELPKFKSWFKVRLREPEVKIERSLSDLRELPPVQKWNVDQELHNAKLDAFE